jgi:eukaryotic-like serine/threonine-protein kinase
MPVAVDLTEASWKAFSALLDRALELAPSDRLAWLDTLDAEHAHLKPALRSLLQRSAGVETARWLDTLPRTPDTLQAPDDSDLQPNALVGPYRLLRELGVGGMGAVWLGERADGTLKRQVALKLPRAVWSAGLAQRMARERDILASLEHPNIARLYDAGTDTQARPFLALEYVEGQPIDLYCRERALNTRSRLALLLQVARAVAFAHSRLVVHRDLKPSNILVTADGQVRLLDFGIAKLMEGDRTQETQLTRLAGQALTLDYASPEQIRGEQIGTASDVYSLGVVSYELLAGAKPYKLKRQTAAQLEEAIAAIDAPLASATATEAAAKRDLKGDLDAILNKALKKNLNERYATVDALALDIERHLAGHRVVARPDSLAYRITRLARRYRTPLIAAAITIAIFALAIGVGAAVLLAIVFAAGMGLALWQAHAARRERDRALRLVERQEGVLSFLNTLITDAARGGQALTAEQLLKRSEALIGPELESDAEVHALVLSMISASMQTLGNSAEALRLSERALTLVRGQHDADVLDAIVITRALAVGWAGRYAEARSALETVLLRPDVFAARRTEAHHYLAYLANANNDAEAALHHAESALRSLRGARGQTRKFEASIRASLGAAYSLHGRMAEADDQFAAAYARQQELGQGASTHAVTLLNNWSVINLRVGDARRAFELAERALELAGAEGRSPFLLMNRARALEDQGRVDEADVGYCDAEKLAAERATVPALAAAHLGQASVHLLRGDLDSARAKLARADEAILKLSATHPQRTTRLWIEGRLALAAGELAAAQAAFDKAIEAAPQQASAVTARLGLAEVALARSESTAALDLARAARTQAVHLQGGKSHSFRTAIATVMCARALEAAGQIEAARREAADALEQLNATVDVVHPDVATATRLAGSLPAPPSRG